MPESLPITWVPRGDSRFGFGSTVAAVPVRKILSSSIPSGLILLLSFWEMPRIENSHSVQLTFVSSPCAACGITSLYRRDRINSGLCVHCSHLCFVLRFYLLPMAMLDHLLRRRKRRLYHTRSSYYNQSLSNDHMPVASCDDRTCAFLCTHGRAYACPRKLHCKHVSLRERSCCSRSSCSKGMARGGQSTSEDA